MENVTLKDLMKYEEVLLRINERYENGEIELRFHQLYKLKTELKKIGEYTDIFFKEIKRLRSEDNISDIDNIENEFLNDLFEYDLSTYLYLISLKSVTEYYKIQ